MLLTTGSCVIGAQYLQDDVKDQASLPMASNVPMMDGTSHNVDRTVDFEFAMPWDDISIVRISEAE